jgi:hypothetical protein
LKKQNRLPPVLTEINEIFLIAMTISMISIIPSSVGGQLLIEDNKIVPSKIRDISHIEEMPKGIPVGEYRITSDGLHGEMNISSLDSKGHFQGTLNLYPFDRKSTITGSFDDISHEIVFSRTIDTEQKPMEYYKGYKFTNVIADCISGTGPGSCYQYATFAGTFESIIQPNQTFGWYASHIPEPCPACPE